MAYTLRLNKNQEKLLEEVKVDIGESTANKTLINLITRFKTDQELIENLTMILSRVDYQFKEIKRLLINKNSTEENIQKLLSRED